MKKVKLLSLFLSLVLVFASFSGFGVYAVGDTLETAQPVEATRVREIESLREVNSQTYLLSDGKYQCVVYAEDKFYEDSRGKLVEISNAISTASHTRGDVSYSYKNKAGKSDVYFSDATGNILINAEKGALTFAPKATRNTAKTVLGTKYSLKAADFIISGDDVIAYTDVYPNMDIVYQVTNSGIKEYTVLKEKPETNAVSYVFEHEGLSVSQGKKTVSFKNAKGDEVFSLGTLFALDNAGNYTENISYKITAVGKYTTEITVALDESYIENASFPIVIDPTVMITGQTNTYDTFTSSKNPNTNYYMNTYVRTGCDAPFGKRHTYMRFVLPSSLNGKTVTTARLNIRVQSGIAPTRVQLRAVESSWTTNTLTWSNEPDSYTLAYNLTLYQNNWYRAILTDMVQDWIDGTEPNYGFILKDPAEGINYSRGVTTDWTTFYSSDAASPNKPELVVEYSEDDDDDSDDLQVPGTISSRYSELLGVEDDYPHDHYSFMSMISPELSATGRYTNRHYGDSFTKSEVLICLDNYTNEIFISRSHGGSTSYGTHIYLDKDCTTTFSDTDITASYDLSNMKLIMYVACSTANGSVNLPSVSCMRGAQCALGFIGDINCDIANAWLDEAVEKLTSGYTISQIISLLNEKYGLTARAYGDGATTLD